VTTYLGEEAEHLARDRLHVVLASCDDEPGDLVPEQHAVGDGHLVLDAVHPLDHPVVEGTRVAPPDRRGDQDDIAPVYNAFIDLLHLVIRIHLRDGTGPGAGVSALGVIALAGPELELRQPDGPRLRA
jgi:hypothetical protein